MTVPVLIVGAGPTGLVMALWLAKAKVPFRIIDQSKGPGETSRAMIIHARTLEFYRQLGLAETVVEKGHKANDVHLFDGPREMAALRLSQIGKGVSHFPFLLSYPQDLNERALIAALEDAGGMVERETTLTALTQDEEGVTAVVRSADGEETISADFVYGADGAHSTVRSELGITLAGGTYPQRFFVADVRAKGGPVSDMNASVGANAVMLRIPVRESGMERIIGFVPKRLAEQEEVSFADLREDVRDILGLEVEELNWFSVYHSHHRVAEAFQVGRVFLGGDAGHVHSPVGGQGMNTGIGDSVNLAWKLAAVHHGSAAPQILNTYEDERLPFAKSLVFTTDLVASAIVSGGILGGLVRKLMMPLFFKSLGRFGAVQKQLFRSISQVRIRYPNSTLSEGMAGRLEAGIRLPFLFTEEGDNFAPLSSRDWQMHIIGEPDEGLAARCTALGLPIHAFPWNRDAKRANFIENGAYLVRPDGYIGLIMGFQSADALDAYCARCGLSLGKANQPETLKRSPPKKARSSAK
ncbi:MAG: FAD-dependent monooxygenase [Pseudomonadota bacterium]